MFLRTCCCCYTLRQGSLVSGIFFMISSAVFLLMEVGLVAEWADVKTSIANRRMREFSHPAIITGIVMSSGYIVLSMVMLKGVKEERKWLLLPWIVWSWLYVLLTIGSAVYHFCTDGLDAVQRVYTSLIYVLVWILWIYCVFCVWSYYLEVSAATRYEKYYSDEKCDEEIPMVSLKRKIYPHSIWEESSTVSSASEKKRAPSRKKRALSDKKRTGSYHHRKQREQRED